MNRLRPWLPALLWAAVIFLLSAIPAPPEIGPRLPFKDKVGHVALYAVLATLIAHALRRAHALPLPKTALLAILITSAYGVTDEWHQRYVPRRSCDVGDWAADTLGGTLAAGLYCKYDTRKSRKTNR
jgi:VanZ family protein